MCSDSWLAVRLRSGVIEVLPHPIEQLRLEQLGFTWDQATREQRFVHYAILVCQTCATMTEADTRDLRLPSAPATWSNSVGLLLGVLFVSVAVVTALLSYTDISLGWRLLMLPGFVVLALLAYIVLVLRLEAIMARVRAPRQRPLPDSTIQCPHCTTGRLYPVGLIAGHCLRCPQCSAQGYTFGFVAVS
jgi:hypothetical protein